MSLIEWNTVYRCHFDRDHLDCDRSQRDRDSRLYTIAPARVSQGGGEGP